MSLVVKRAHRTQNLARPKHNVKHETRLVTAPRKAGQLSKLIKLVSCLDGPGPDRDLAIRAVEKMESLIENHERK